MTQWLQNTYSLVCLKHCHKYQGFGCFVITYFTVANKSRGSRLQSCSETADCLELSLTAWGWEGDRKGLCVFWTSENSPKHLDQPTQNPHSLSYSIPLCHLLVRPCPRNLWAGQGKEDNPKSHGCENPPGLSDMEQAAYASLSLFLVPGEPTVMQRREQGRRGAYFILHLLP